MTWPLSWLIVLVIGAAIGWVASAIGSQRTAPPVLFFSLSIGGALAGSLLYRVAGFPSFGTAGFYFFAAIGAIVIMTGGLYSWTIVSRERRD